MKEGYKQCPYCGEGIREIAKKCRFCGEFLTEMEYKETKKKELTMEDLPNNRKELNARQKEVLIKNFPLTGLYKVLVFFFPRIFLLYARRYWLFIFLLITLFIPHLNIIIRIAAGILICANWKSWCYSKDAINMKRTLILYRKRWDKADSDYNDSKINGNVNRRLIVLGLLGPIITLVLIVVYGLMIASLMPRDETAQGRSRDVSRQTALSLIKSAILSSQQDNGKRPGMNNAKNRISVSNIKTNLILVGMYSIPKDPSNNQDYMYMVSKKNGIDDAGFILMAETENEGGSNRVICSNGDGYIKPNTDLANVNLCKTISKGNECYNSNGNCTYTSTDQLRYILIY